MLSASILSMCHLLLGMLWIGGALRSEVFENSSADAYRSLKVDPYELRPLRRGQATACAPDFEITTLEECNAAASTVSPGVRTIETGGAGDVVALKYNENNYPRGCYIYDQPSRNILWFNSGSGGYHHSISSVCKAHDVEDSHAVIDQTMDEDNIALRWMPEKPWHYKEESCAGPEATIRVLNQATVPLNILAITSIRKTAHPFNSVRAGESTDCFPAGMSGEWNFQVLIDDGEFSWGQGDDEQWRASKKFLTGNLLTKAVLHTTGAASIVGVAASATLGAVFGGPIVVVGAMAAAYAFSDWVGMHVDQFVDDAFWNDRMQQYSSVYRRSLLVNKVKATHDKRKFSFTEIVTEIPVLDAYAKALGNPLGAKSEMAMSTMEELLLSKAHALQYLESLDRKFSVSTWQVHFTEPITYAIRGGFSCPDGDNMVTFTELHWPSESAVATANVDENTVGCTRKQRWDLNDPITDEIDGREIEFNYGPGS